MGSSKKNVESLELKVESSGEEEPKTHPQMRRMGHPARITAESAEGHGGRREMMHGLRVGSDT